MLPSAFRWCRYIVRRRASLLVVPLKRYSQLDSTVACSFTRSLCSVRYRSELRGFQSGRRFLSISKRELHESRDHFKRFLLYMQKGDNEMAIKEMDNGYSDGYRLPKGDVFMLIAKICESKNWKLVEHVLTILESKDPAFIHKHAPLFCYALLLSGDIQQSFSLLSTSGSAYLEEQIENLKESLSTSKVKSPPLPQEYLFARLCIQLMCNANGIKLPNSIVSYNLPRRNERSILSNLQSNAILMCYVMEWKYLHAAMSKNVQSHPGDRSSLKNLFPSPYTVVTGSSTKLEECAFSSFTLRYCSQRLKSTLRGLELMLWYQYSRCIYDMNPTDPRLHDGDDEMILTIEDVFSNMQPDYMHWNQGIFEFFVFYYSQPILYRNEKQRADLVMRDHKKVIELLDEMKRRGLRLSHSLALALITKKDLPKEALCSVMNSFLDENLGRSALEKLVTENVVLIDEYVNELSRRNEVDLLESFHAQLCYLNLSLPESSMNSLLISAIYIDDNKLVNQLLTQMKERGMKLNPEATCSLLFGECYHEKDVSLTLQGIDYNWSDEWTLYLAHLLFQISSFQSSQQKDSYHSSKVGQILDFCKRHQIVLSAELCQKLFDFYLTRGDHKNLVHLFYWMKRKNYKLLSDEYSQMERVVNQISRSKMSILGVDAVSPPNRKYDSVQINRSWRRVLCLFTKDSHPVSLDTILKAVVEELCMASIEGYGSWLYE